MRYICFLFFLLYINASAVAQADNPDSLTGFRAATGSVRILCVETPVDSGKRPLVIIDGKITAFDSLNTFRPDDIERMEVVKPGYAQALYGVKGTYGIILITTKSNQPPPLIIRDAENGDPVPGATLTFIRESDKKELQLIADGFGQVQTDVLKRGEKYKLTITSVGYKSFHTTFISSNGKKVTNYRLTKDVRENETVTVKGSVRTISCGWGYGCGGVLNGCDLMKPDSNEQRTSVELLKIFPNPVEGGSFVKIEMNDPASSSVQIKFVNLSGAVLSALSYKPLKGLNRIEIPVAGHWAAGAYFILVTGENGKLLKQSKLLIQ